MTLDPVRNKAFANVTLGYDALATSIALVTGGAAKFPSVISEGPFNLVWWNFTDYPNSADDPNMEIVRVTGITGDTLTLTRGQEGASAMSHNIAGKVYRVALMQTKKMIDDIRTQLDALIAAKPLRVRGVLSGTSNTKSFTSGDNAILSALTANSDVSADWDLNDFSNSPLGALYVSARAGGSVEVRSTVDEGTDKNIVLTVWSF